MKSAFNRNYPFQLWLNSCLWGSAYLAIAFIIWYEVDHTELDKVVGGFLISILFSAVFSWLIFLGCYFIFHRLPRHNLRELKRIKPVISAVAITGILLLSVFFGINFRSEDPEWLIPFCFILGILTATGTTRLLRPKTRD